MISLFNVNKMRTLCWVSQKFKKNRNQEAINLIILLIVKLLIFRQSTTIFYIKMLELQDLRVINLTISGLVAQNSKNLIT